MDLNGSIKIKKIKKDLDTETFNYTIYNNSDINDLVKQVESILKQENII